MGTYGGAFVDLFFFGFLGGAFDSLLFFAALTNWATQKKKQQQPHVLSNHFL